jgi:Cys-rich four helix bundle protein (predicted Tat secretion target)
MAKIKMLERDDDAALSRRAALGLAVGAGLIPLLNFAGRAAADDDDHMSHMDHMGQMDHMDHMGMDHSNGLSQHQGVMDAALNCVKRGEVCFNHCVALLSKGDTSMKDCIRTVSAMLPTCSSLAQLAALDSPRLKEFASVCIKICEDCRDECKKHADHHAVCKNCMDSCTECIEQCRKLTAA